MLNIKCNTVRQPLLFFKQVWTLNLKKGIGWFSTCTFITSEDENFMDALGGHQTARRWRHGGGGDGTSAVSAGGVMWWRPRHSLQKIGLQSWRWIPYPSTSAAAARAMAWRGGARCTVVHQFTNWLMNFLSLPSEHWAWLIRSHFSIHHEICKILPIKNIQENV